jgi:ABC-type lipoprotein release transport system permease subunit
MASNPPDHEWKKGSAELLVLSLLEGRPRHGYDISKLIQVRSDGALKFHVTSLYPGEGMLLVAAGVAIGLVAALAAGGLLARMLYGVSAGDPISVVGAASILLAVALVACYLPARSASRLDPLAALREG